ncbi:protein tyrosine kinase [Teladorsagia circumcincta]|uniref:Protein tyrosine kinase n=1 Tax=Teladorsagia circumcincta TaxID=45464 RepID=A0A2G9TY15_TELCI|nr:protein tyrosine kinase [Teladorsagia circumcincta]
MSVLLQQREELELKSARDDDAEALDGKLAEQQAHSFLELKGAAATDKSGKEQKREAVVMDLGLEKILADLEKEEWYHGCLPFEDIAGLLVDGGDFLIRGVEAQENQNIAALVTVKWGWNVEDYPIRFHQSTETPVYGQVVLRKAIPKQQWELTNDKITKIKVIGSGAFGEVWLGNMQESPKDPPVNVAIKVTKVNEKTKTMIDEMYREARLMRQYQHKNIVRFYGVVQQKSAGSAMIVMEYIDGGALDEHLRKNTDVPPRTRVDYGIDVAVGLVYLHSKGCMHRDIACRNCLIDVTKGIVKISDFGMSKQGDFYKIPGTEKLPIKWQAPEVISTRVYTAKCDVYSYGILLWEIFNNGETPYKGIDNKTVREKISNPNFRPPTDATLPIVIYRVMKTCWRANPVKRPSMAQIARYLVNAPPEL